MNEQPDKSMIAKLLEDLRNKGRYRDINAIQKTIASIEKIVKNRIRDEQIITALTQLASSDPDKIVRDSALNALDKLEDESVLAELNMHSGGEASESVRATESETHRPAEESSGKSKTPLTHNEKIRDFLIGFAGWYVINALIWILISQPISADFGRGVQTSMLLLCIPLPINIISLFIFRSVRNWIAQGIIVAFATNFIFTLIQGALSDPEGALYAAIDAVPFFIVPFLPCGVFGPC